MNRQSIITSADDVEEALWSLRDPIEKYFRAKKPYEERLEAVLKVLATASGVQFGNGIRAFLESPALTEQLREELLPIIKRYAVVKHLCPECWNIILGHECSVCSRNLRAEDP
jgi:hypothetical protein